MINKVMLIGNIGQDPEVKHLESGSVVARFSVATNENYKDKSGEWQTITEWHSVTCWRALAELVERTYKKGMMVYVEGKLTTR
ncbi:single-stranded DNA-binding protein, partial [Saprospiraceae bacterium]|nr:single-stranded DNA-binding protein [Saprospiraceae bacterium]